MNSNRPRLRGDAALNPRLIYCSISAFGQDGPRSNQTAYDHVIQATSGLMATTGTEEVNPIKFGSPAVDYATGTMGAFALATALFQRERTGQVSASISRCSMLR